MLNNNIFIAIVHFVNRNVRVRNTCYFSTKFDCFKIIKYSKIIFICVFLISMIIF